MFNDYVKTDTTPLYSAKTDNAKVCHLLWGDGVRFLPGGKSGGRRKVKARGRIGWVTTKDLGGNSLLEFYFIDVGQGDGILIKTPDFRHVMIDGGFHRYVQDTGKNAADFVDWKFVKDYGKKRIDLDAMIVSHCDADHYGGLSDLLDVSQSNELKASGVRVEKLYHAGLSWWRTSANGKTLGPSEPKNGQKFWTRLLDNRSSVKKAITTGPGNKLHGLWKKFFEIVYNTKRKSGQPTSIQRLSHLDQYVPGFAPGAQNQPTIRVLGPVEFKVNGKPAVRKFTGGNSKNTNGVSLLLRVDYGRTRVILTGDLNQASQTTLLDDYTGRRSEFQCDVAKSCHHGSEDISYRFLEAMRPAVTVISSGDNEGHDHPRPSVIAASATTGYMELKDDKLVTPLVYSTELARSVDFGHPTKLEEKDANGKTTNTLRGKALMRSVLHLKKTKRDYVKLEHALVVGGLIYGLVNIRTDGDRILCATMDEKSKKWRIETIKSRF